MSNINEYQKAEKDLRELADRITVLLNTISPQLHHLVLQDYANLNELGILARKYTTVSPDVKVYIPRSTEKRTVG